VSQNIVGDINLSTNIIMEDVVLLELARRFYGGKLTEIDELALDSAAEFLNVHNGVFSGNLSNDGVEANLLPQQIQKYNGESSNMTYRISIGLSFGRIDLMLSSEDE
jgi:CheY-specific phosphatase CheX